ncbi:MAG: DNA-binding transcriptional repressor MarR [Methanoregula sp. PtaU1.Bin051]|nr:MAG: DNA-binding transcriptional repressor MarR [Methanoregula sp. PtaU1.Bin051]
MDEELIDRTAGHLLSLIPLYRHKILKQSHGITGIQGAQFRLLHILSQNGTQRMSEIGRRLYISKPYMTALVDSLIRDGFVRRQPDPKDRRVIRIAITGKGQLRLSTMAALIKENIGHDLSSLETSDLEILCRALQDLRTVLEKIPED